MVSRVEPVSVLRQEEHRAGRRSRGSLCSRRSRHRYSALAHHRRRPDDVRVRGRPAGSCPSVIDGCAPVPSTPRAPPATAPGDAAELSAAAAMNIAISEIEIGCVGRRRAKRFRRACLSRPPPLPRPAWMTNEFSRLDRRRSSCERGGYRQAASGGISHVSSGPFRPAGNHVLTRARCQPSRTER